MMKKLPILSILVFSMISKTVYSQIGNSFQLRVFPELRGEKIQEIYVIDSYRAIAVGRDALFKWEGSKWQEFYPPFPMARLSDLWRSLEL